MSEPIFVPSVSPRSYYRKPSNNTPLIIGGVILAVLAFAGVMVLVDELRFWNAQRHMKEQLREINRQSEKADRDIKKASDEFTRAMERLAD